MYTNIHVMLFVDELPVVDIREVEFWMRRVMKCSNSYFNLFAITQRDIN